MKTPPPPHTHTPHWHSRRCTFCLQGAQRSSNLELYRVIVMLLIIAHHYVVNSGLEEVMSLQPTSSKSIFLYLFGMWGKTGINCFVMITGYFMCKSSITLKKFLKLLLEVEFYNIVINLLFVLTGYESYTIKEWLMILWPIESIGDGFVSCFLMFYLFIPFLNVLVQNLNKRMHLHLLMLCLFIYTILGTSNYIPVRMNYVIWFCVLYILASYIRLYGLDWKGKSINWGIMTSLSIVVSMASVIVLLFFTEYIRKTVPVYYFVTDSNKIMAVITAVCSFMYFKDLQIKQSKLINVVAASTFGVLLIHANSNTMRQWLWRDTLDNVGAYVSPYIILHALVSVVVIFILCILIDYLRIRWVEKPLFGWINMKNIF